MHMPKVVSKGSGQLRISAAASICGFTFSSCIVSSAMRPLLGSPSLIESLGMGLGSLVTAAPTARSMSVDNLAGKHMHIVMI